MRWLESVAAALALIVGVGCAGESDEPRSRDPRSLLEASGFTDVRIVGEEDGVVAFEAMKEGERCSGEASFAPSGEPRIASRCEAEGEQQKLEAACTAGEAEACAEAAAGIRANPPIDWPKATRFAKHACMHGLPEECLHVGLAHEFGERGVPQDLEQARAMYERACEAGNAPACTRLNGLPR